MPNSQLLAINVAPEKLGKLRLLCARVKARLVIIEKPNFHTPLGVLAGIAEYAQRPQDAPQEPDEDMLVMVGFTGAQMNMFLQDYKRFGVPPIALKAMLTNTNALWTPAKLHVELSAERAAFERGERAHELKQPPKSE